MAVAILHEAKASRSDGNARLILFGLADCADGESRITYPGNAWLAEFANCDVSTVKRALEELESIGDILCVERGGGRGRYTKWRIAEFAKGRNLRPFAGVGQGNGESPDGPPEPYSGDGREPSTTPHFATPKGAQSAPVSENGKGGETGSKPAQNRRTLNNERARASMNQEEEPEQLLPPPPPKGGRSRDWDLYQNQMAEFERLCPCQIEHGGLVLELSPALAEQAEIQHTTRWLETVHLHGLLSARPVVLGCNPTVLDWVQDRFRGLIERHLGARVALVPCTQKSPAPGEDRPGLGTTSSDRDAAAA